MREVWAFSPSLPCDWVFDVNHVSAFPTHTITFEQKAAKCNALSLIVVLWQHIGTGNNLRTLLLFGTGDK